MQTLLLVALGGGVGAVMRYLTGVLTMRALGPGWPHGTLAVNVVGGLLMGVLISVLALRGGADQERWRLLLGVGVLGGYTTFSSYALEVALMIERGQLARAATYAFGSMALSIGALFIGLALMRRILL